MSAPESEPVLADSPPARFSEKRSSRLRRWSVRGGAALVIVMGIWLMLAYLILPLAWRHYEHNPTLADAPKTTVTGQGIPATRSMLV